MLQYNFSFAVAYKVLRPGVLALETDPEVIIFFMFNSTEHEISAAYKN